MSKIEFDCPTVLAVEHGKTAFSEGKGREDRIHGTKYDKPLLPEGRREMGKVGATLSGYAIASVEHSPALRTTQSAEIISNAVGVPAQKREGLRPPDVGFFSGMRHSAAKEGLFYFIANPHKTMPGGEKYGDWYDAFSEEFASGLKRAEQTPGKAHVKVLHSSDIINLPSVIKGEPPKVENRPLPKSGQILMVEKRGGQWRMREFNG